MEKETTTTTTMNKDAEGDVIEVRFLMPLVRFVHTIACGYTVVTIGSVSHLVYLVVKYQDSNEEKENEGEEEEEGTSPSISDSTQCFLCVTPESAVVDGIMGKGLPPNAEISGCKVSHISPFTQTHYLCDIIGFNDLPASDSPDVKDAGLPQPSDNTLFLTIAVAIPAESLPSAEMADFFRTVSKITVPEADRMRLSYGCQFGTIIGLRSPLSVGTPLLTYPLEPEPSAGTGYFFSWYPTYTSKSQLICVQEWGFLVNHEPRVVLVIDDTTCLPLSLVPDRKAAALLVELLLKVEEVIDDESNILEMVKATPEPIFGVPIGRRYAEGVVPPVVCDAVRVLTKIAPSHKLIFRVSGSKDEIDVLKMAYDIGVPVDLERCINKDTVGSFLKRYLMELPEPLIPWDVFSQYADLGRGDEDESNDIFELISVSIGKTEKMILVKLIRLVQLIITNVEHTKMSAHATAVCIVPSITRNLANTITMEDVKQLTYIINLFEKKIFTTDLDIIEKAFDERSLIL